MHIFLDYNYTYCPNLSPDIGRLQFWVGTENLDLGLPKRVKTILKKFNSVKDRKVTNKIRRVRS